MDFDNTVVAIIIGWFTFWVAMNWYRENKKKLSELDMYRRRELDRMNQPDPPTSGDPTRRIRIKEDARGRRSN